LRERIGHGVLLLDAAMGTELNRRGVSTALPLWSARALIERPEVVRQIHVDNLIAGADIITTNTFRTTSRTLRAAGLAPTQAASLTRLAVQLAREARQIVGRPDALIAGSIAPLEDCYSPWLTPPPIVAAAEHREQAVWLAAAGVDLLLVETMPTSGEAEVALTAALGAGLPATVGFVCAAGDRTDDPISLLSGEPLAAAASRLRAAGPAAILVNCSAPAVITRALSELAPGGAPFGGYANLGEVDPVSGWRPNESVTGEEYADHAARWLGMGASVIGGCCGTTTVHTAALRRLIDRGAAPDRAAH
jgi:S-methylmethionine-dependent homocysteine/selenocysteine methylase